MAPGADHILAWLGFALGVCGRKAEARAVLEQFQRSERYILPTNFAHVHLGLGELDAAFEWFDRAVEERDQNMMPILSYAHFDPLRGDPRFAALLRKSKLGSNARKSARRILQGEGEDNMVFLATRSFRSESQETESMVFPEAKTQSVGFV